MNWTVREAMMPVRGIDKRIRRMLPHLPPAEVEEMARVLQRLAHEFHSDQLYVFGSQARGTAGPDSDIDLLVVVSATSEPTCRLASAAYAVLASLRLPAEVLFMTRAEFDARTPAVASLPPTALREGRLLYAA